MSNLASNPAPDALWNVKQVSEWLSVTELALRTMLKRGQLPAEAILRLGRRIRFRSDLIRHWALQQRIA